MVDGELTKDEKRKIQAEKIENEKEKLQRQLMWQIFISFLVSAAFYGATLY